MLDVSRQVFEQPMTAARGDRDPRRAGVRTAQRSVDCDMISFGPDINHAHSPDEEVSVPSVGVVVGQVEALLLALCTR